MSTNPYAPPDAPVADGQETLGDYAGFWIRVGAAFIDSICIMLVTWPLLYAIYGEAYFENDSFIAGPADVLISWVLPAVGSIAFWLTRQATPGKMAVAIKIVDAKTGGKLSMGQSVVRYLGYFIAMVPLGLGLLWVAFDARKQGWHDKMAGSVVVGVKR